MSESGQNNQNGNEEENLKKSELIKKLCHCSYSKEEKKNIFLSENGRKCQTCHKLKINKKLSPYNFSQVHQQYICLCDIRARSQQQNYIHNNVENNRNSVDNISNQNQNNNDPNYDNSGDVNMNDGNDIRQNDNNNYSQNRLGLNLQIQRGNRTGVRNRHANNRQDNNNENGDNRSDGNNQHGNNDNNDDNESGGNRDNGHENNGHNSHNGHNGNNGNNGDGGNGHGNNHNNNGNNYVTQEVFNTTINRIDARIDEINRNIQDIQRLLFQNNQNHN